MQKFTTTKEELWDAFKLDHTPNDNIYWDECPDTIILSGIPVEEECKACKVVSDGGSIHAGEHACVLNPSPKPQEECIGSDYQKKGIISPTQHKHKPQSKIEEIPIKGLIFMNRELATKINELIKATNSA